MGEPVNVAVGVLVEDRGGRPCVLIARRLGHLVLGGYWELPGGKFDAGESAAQCLHREFVEELGLVVRVGRALPTIEFAYDHGYICLHPFYCRRVSGEPHNLQVEEHRWVPAVELGEYEFPEANAELMRCITVELEVAGDVES